MKKLALLFVIVSFCGINAQENNTSYKPSSFVSADYLGLTILAQDGVNHLATSYPRGMVVSWNKRTFGKNRWEEYFNYPDYGLSFSYEDFRNPILGEVYALYGHFNYYFFNRASKNNLIFHFALGTGYATNPFDKVTNNKNVALGSTFNISSYFKVNYVREDIFKNIGLQAGFVFLHSSNSSVTSPNKGINSYGFNIGLNYKLDQNDSQKYIKTVAKDTTTYNQPIKFNAVVMAGINESDHINTGKYPFATLSVYADKRFNRKHGLQLGAEIDFHSYLKNHIPYLYTFQGDVNRTDFPDWRRVSVFLGYELYINKLSLYTQLGYYVSAPEILNETIYERIGTKYYINKALYTSISVKAHIVNAEALEFGIGYRF